ncbi:MAG: hypothetical protein GY920_05550 [Aliivibrio sp.]|jgi:hypothetical protein|nr:hypothetical protein [Aliivibrio sp.]
MSKLGKERNGKGYVVVTTADGTKKKLDKRSDEYKRYILPKQKNKRSTNTPTVGVRGGLYTGGSSTGTTQM